MARPSPPGGPASGRPNGRPAFLTRAGLAAGLGRARYVMELWGRLLDALPVGGWGGLRGDPDRLGRRVVRLYEAGRYRQARELARRLVDVQRVRLGERHPDYASALTNLAVLLQAEGDLDASEPLLRQAAAVRKEALGEGDPRYAASLCQLAELLQLRGDAEAAEPLLRRALEVRREALGEHHPDYATGLTALAILLHRRGDAGAAEPLLRQALEVRREALGDRHPMVATAMGNLGLVLQRRGDLSAAEPLLRQALEVRREALGEHHPDVAASLSQLATLLFERHDHNSAEPLLRQAVSVRKRTLGEHHPDVVADLQTIAAISQARARPSVKVCDGGGPGKVTRPGPSDSPPEPSRRGTREVAAEARALAERIKHVGAALGSAASRMQEGAPVDLALLHDATACQHAFRLIRDEGLHRARAFDLAPPDGALLLLPDLAVLLDRVAGLEDDLQSRADAHRRALADLDLLLLLRHHDPAEATLLAAVHEAASSLRNALADARISSGFPEVASSLADGSHPLCALLRLIESAPALDDHDWNRLYLQVANDFGPSLAAAAVRGRLELDRPDRLNPMNW